MRSKISPRGLAARFINAVPHPAKRASAAHAGKAAADPVPANGDVRSQSFFSVTVTQRIGKTEAGRSANTDASVLAGNEVRPDMERLIRRWTDTFRTDDAKTAPLLNSIAVRIQGQAAKTGQGEVPHALARASRALFQALDPQGGLSLEIRRSLEDSVREAERQPSNLYGLLSLFNRLEQGQIRIDDILKAAQARQRYLEAYGPAVSQVDFYALFGRLLNPSGTGWSRTLASLRVVRDVAAMGHAIGSMSLAAERRSDHLWITSADAKEYSLAQAKYANLFQTDGRGFDDSRARWKLDRAMALLANSGAEAKRQGWPVDDKRIYLFLPPQAFYFRREIGLIQKDYSLPYVHISIQPLEVTRAAVEESFDPSFNKDRALAAPSPNKIRPETRPPDLDAAKAGIIRHLKKELRSNPKRIPALLSTNEQSDVKTINGLRNFFSELRQRLIAIQSRQPVSAELSSIIEDLLKLNAKHPLFLANPVQQNALIKLYARSIPLIGEIT